MSLYGALFGGVSGLRAQSSKIGVISDNIANVNTVGYKQGTATFSSLVVNSDSTVSYQTGGVRGSTLLKISKQGLLQSTESSTDVAISGGGFFVVKASPEKSTVTTPYYTRAGSFTQDSLGNFVNTQGYFLQGWPLDRNGNLPGEGNNLNTTSYNDLTSLETVNVESASGSAQATSTVSLGANLKSSEKVYGGQAGTFKLDSANAANQNLTSTSIIAGAEYGMAGVDSVRRGDTFSVSTGNGLSYSYEYGGFSIGRQVSNGDASLNSGDGSINNKSLLNLDAATNISYSGGSTYIVTIPNHGLISGDEVTFSGLNAIGTTPAAELNATHVITRLSDNTFSITTATGPGASPTISADAFQANTRVYKGNILDATSASANFLSLTSANSFTSAAKTFTISNATAGTVTFTYSSTTPNTLNGEFNNLNTLADAIDKVNGLTARVVNGRLVVGAEDASEAVTFANGDAVGDTTKRGIDWVGELDVKNVDSSTRRYSSLAGLSKLAESDDGISSSIDNPLASPTLNIRVDDPLDTIRFDDSGAGFTIPTTGSVAIPNGSYAVGATIPISIDLGVIGHNITTSSRITLAGITNALGGLPGVLPNGGPYQVTAVSGSVITVSVVAQQPVTISGSPLNVPSTARMTVAGVSNQGSVLAHLGIQEGGVTSLANGTYTAAQTTSQLGPQYDPSGSVGKNMASGDITAQFSRNVRIYDGLGAGHDIRFSFIKTATNTWAVEIHAIPASDISTSLVDGQIATGSIVFNGDGSLRSVSSTLTDTLNVVWNNGASASKIDLDLGTAGQQFGTPGATAIGLTDGLSQFDSAYNVNFANQNGAPVGQLVSVSISDDGKVVASYSNGETQALYQLPLADFASPDSLRSISGNVYAQTRDSGEVNLRQAGTNGTGKIVAAALEQSNVDLAEQLTDMIVAQRSYQANTKVIKTADDLLDQLNQI